MLMSENSKDWICEPSSQCVNCMSLNKPNQPPTTQPYVSELETLDLLNEEQELEEEYVYDRTMMTLMT